MAQDTYAGPRTGKSLAACPSPSVAIPAARRGARPACPGGSTPVTSFPRRAVPLSARRGKPFRPSAPPCAADGVTKPAIAKREWRGQYVFWELFFVLAAWCGNSARSGPWRAGVNEGTATLHLAHIRTPQLQRSASSHLTCRPALSAGAPRLRNRTSDAQPGSRGTDGTTTGLYEYTRGRPLGYAFRKPVNCIITDAL